MCLPGWPERTTTSFFQLVRFKPVRSAKLPSSCCSDEACAWVALWPALRVAMFSFFCWSSQQDLHKRIILTPRAQQSLADWARHQPPQAITVMVGPEGGFSEAEEKAALAAGAIGLSMGPRILRTETAGLTALATLGALWDGM